MTVNELIIDHITKRYRRKTVINEVSFNLHRVRFTACWGVTEPGKVPC